MKDKLNKQITIDSMIKTYGQYEASIILDREIRHAIIATQHIMRNAKPMYSVLLKDPTAGRLIIKTDHVLNLQFIGKDGKRRDLFTESEVNTMRKLMPGFDKYYEIRRVGFDNE